MQRTWHRGRHVGHATGSAATRRSWVATYRVRVRSLASAGVPWCEPLTHRAAPTPTPTPTPHNVAQGCTTTRRFWVTTPDTSDRDTVRFARALRLVDTDPAEFSADAIVVGVYSQDETAPSRLLLAAGAESVAV